MNPSHNSTAPASDETAETETPSAPAKLPIVATLVLLSSGAAAQLVKLPGRKQKYPFVLERGAGFRGKAAHVRHYTDINAFHAEEEDIRATRQPHFVVTRLGEISHFEAARAGIERLINDPVGSPADKQAQLQKLLEQIAAALPAPAPAPEPEPETTTVVDENPPQDEGAVDQSKIEERRRELRRMGEDEARKLVRDEYQIGGVQLLDNPDGLIEAVLRHEEELGKFDKNPAPVQVVIVEHETPGPIGASVPPAALPASAAPAPAVPAAVAVALPPGAPPAPPLGTMVHYTEAQLAQTKIELLRAIAKEHGVSGNSRKALIAGILEKQAGKK